MFQKAFLTIVLFHLSFSLAFAQAGLDTLKLKDLFFEPYLPGVRPGFTSFSADLDKIYFSWNDSSYHETDTYQVNLGGEKLKKAPEDAVISFHPSPDLSKIAYIKNGRLILSDPDFREEHVLVDPVSGISDIAWSPGGSEIAFTKRNEIWVTSINEPHMKQITTNSGNNSFRIEDWVGDDRLLLRSTDSSNVRTIYFPDYLGEFVKPGSASRGIPHTTFAVADLETTTIDTLVSNKNRSSTETSASGRFVAIDYADPALKTREIRIYDLEEGKMTIVFKDTTDGWLYGTHIEFNPEQDILMFQSEKNNWNHIYTVNPDGTGLKQHTNGDFDIPWAAWMDQHTIVYASTEEDPGVRHIYTVNIRNENLRKLTETPAYRYQFQMSQDNRFLVFAKTYFNEPYDLYRLNLQRPEREIQLTNTVPERFREIEWQKEDYIRFTGRDGDEISMSVLYPPDFDDSDEYPVVVFFHGAGSLQNVYKGWSNNYWREYMFHQYLNMHGYIVVEVDFRHSTGYGRKFREDVTGWMGRYETIDTIDGLDWLQENKGGLDLTRVGSYGGSYGGFMALYATSVEPERFHAAAALRAVTNWQNYYYANPWYTKPRLGTPENDPDHYDRSSPLTYASGMEHPVLILHGLIDDNVGFQDAVQYIEELIQAGHEDFEMMMYPSERHSFDEPAAWYDEYRRIFEFFEKHLKD